MHIVNDRKIFLFYISKLNRISNRINHIANKNYLIFINFFYFIKKQVPLRINYTAVNKHFGIQEKNISK